MILMESVSDKTFSSERKKEEKLATHRLQSFPVRDEAEHDDFVADENSSKK
jgi:hypothetical protein